MTELPPPSPGPPPAPLPPPGAPPPPPPAYRPVPPPQTRSQSELWFWTAVAAGALAVAAALLPWVTASTIFGSFSRNGIDGGGDGLVTGLLGVVVAVLALGTRRNAGGRGVGIAIAACSLIIVAVSAYDFFSVNDRVNDIDRQLGEAGVGIGLYLTILAGMAGVAAGVFRVRGSLADELHDRR